MSTISLQLPDSLHDQVRRLAEQDHISIDRFIATAVAEKMSALMTADYLEQRAKRADRRKCEEAMAKVSDRPPVPGDEL
jgi:predicted transcriptional regulator